MGRPANNLIGQKFGYLTVIERAGSSPNGHANWKCRCDCGNECFRLSNQLKRKNGNPSCGCKVSEIISKKAQERFENLAGQKFGLLTPIEKVGSTGESILWRCQCDCGNNNFITTAHHLKSDNTKSCGCLKSYGEYIIQQILIQNQILFIKEKIFDDFTYENSDGIPRFDFYLPEYPRLIEFDGKQHYESCGKLWDSSSTLPERQQRDQEKNEYAKSHNIPLVRIPYWERDKITLDMIMGDKYLIK